MEQLSANSTRFGRTRIRPPQIVNRLDAFLREHFDEPIHMAQLCDVTGVSERSLRNACHAVHGTSPKRYVTRRRMEAVHDALVEAQPGDATVTRIATDHGFYELGRFAAMYTSLFGERPSVTLRRTIVTGAARHYAESAAPSQNVHPNDSDAPKSFRVAAAAFGRLSKAS